jgi:hypothetical protein
MCWEKKTHLSKGLCGSEPYIAPEQFELKGVYSTFILPTTELVTLTIYPPQQSTMLVW